ncbi:hypothetical protein [uncultured Chryseobacterium sp.]|uniref:hypothetical protein n=1 Tax=uncultured Chryseobacterium sp. TaxID=259322 RepID=UPI00258B8772|nr:hypothetical protein [uncultured Chryseobacterium sp.]
MSHQEKQRIFDAYAQKQGFQKWEDLVMFSGFTFSGRLALINHMYNACDLVQEEQQKRIAENVNSETIQTTFGPFECYDKDSIINPENLIK